ARAVQQTPCQQSVPDWQSPLPNWRAPERQTSHSSGCRDRPRPIVGLNRPSGRDADPDSSSRTGAWSPAIARMTHTGIGRRVRVPWREHLHGWRGGSLPDMRMGRLVRRAVNMTGPARRAAGGTVPCRRRPRDLGGSTRLPGLPVTCSARAAESPAPARTARAAGTAAAATALAGCGFEADDIAGLEALGLFDDVEFD